MSRYGVTPNVRSYPTANLHRGSPWLTQERVRAQMLIIPPQLSLYMALAPESKLTYKEGGPAAEARFEAGVAGFESRAFRGCGVFTSEPFEVSDDADAVQMLTRSTQCGEFYIMSPPTTMSGTAGEGWRPHMCDMIIYGAPRRPPCPLARAHARPPLAFPPAPVGWQTRRPTSTCASRGRRRSRPR